MNHLMRELAPITDDSWSQIDAEAARSLKHYLAARRLVDFIGPEGLGALGGRSRAGRRPRQWTARGGRGGAPQGHAAHRAPGSVLAVQVRAGRRRPGSDRPRSGPGDRRRPAPPPWPRTTSSSTGTRRGGLRHCRRLTPPAGGHQRRLRPLPRTRGQGGRRPAGRRHAGSLRHRPRVPLLHRSHRDHRARRLPGVRTSPPDPRRTGGVGTGGGRRRGAQPARRGLRADHRRGLLGRLPVRDAGSVELFIEESLAFRINTPEAAVHLTYK